MNEGNCREMTLEEVIEMMIDKENGELDTENVSNPRPLYVAIQIIGSYFSVV